MSLTKAANWPTDRTTDRATKRLHDPICFSDGLQSLRFRKSPSLYGTQSLFCCHHRFPIGLYFVCLLCHLRFSNSIRNSAMHQIRLNCMRAFVVTMSALGNEDVLTVGSPCNSKLTRIINLPHTLLHFQSVGGPGILFFFLPWRDWWRHWSAPSL